MDDSVLAGGRPTWAEVDLDALAWNLRAITAFLSDAGAATAAHRPSAIGHRTPDVATPAAAAKPSPRIIAVVKADAYGHGAAECARRLEAEGAEWFGVATPEEGLALRRAGVTRPILSFGGFWEGQAAACVAEGLVPVVYRLGMAWQNVAYPLTGMPRAARRFLFDRARGRAP